MRTNSFDWREFLALAIDIAGKSGEGYSLEATNRSAVSRAYYAAFCTAREYAIYQWGFIATHTGRDHRALVAHLEQANLWKLSRRLVRLRQWRNLCDYQTVVNNLSSITEQALQLAQEVIDACQP
jgi:hypothetical protein